MEIKKMVDKKKINKGFKIVNCWVREIITPTSEVKRYRVHRLIFYFTISVGLFLPFILFLKCFKIFV